MSGRRPGDIYERWLYRIAVRGDDIACPSNGFVAVSLPAFLTEMVIEAEWLGSLSELQRAARDALIAYMNVQIPELAIRTNTHFIDAMLESCHLDAINH